MVGDIDPEALCKSLLVLQPATVPPGTVQQHQRLTLATSQETKFRAGDLHQLIAVCPSHPSALLMLLCTAYSVEIFAPSSDLALDTLYGFLHGRTLAEPTASVKPIHHCRTCVSIV
jgi:hypothetical protein